MRRPLFILMLVLLPALATAQAEIRVARTAAAVGADPDHPAWDAAPAVVVKLETAFPGHPSISGTAVAQAAEIRALATSAGLSIRLEWRDAAANATTTPHRFADGAAVQFAGDGKTDTAPYMGGGGRHVNIWYWNAAADTAQNLWADGFGTLARLPAQDVAARGRRLDGAWRVAFFRPWRSKEARAARLDGKPAPVAFAVWDGANDERDGFKAVTLKWQMLRLR